MIQLKRKNNNFKSFEDIKHIDDKGNEFWYARELMKILEYNKWENFEKVINKAKNACENSGISAFDIFLTLGSCQNVLIMLKLKSKTMNFLVMLVT